MCIVGLCLVLYECIVDVFFECFVVFVLLIWIGNLFDLNIEMGLFMLK